MRKPILLVMLFLAACTSSSVLGLHPQGAEPLTPPAIYLTWWGEVESCALRYGPFGDIKWWVTSDLSWDVQEETAVGQFIRGNITVAERMVNNEYVVKHEMLHALGFNHPDTNRPPYPWPFNTCTL